MEKVSIIIPVYNAEMWLERCVDSVLSQTYKSIEIILVDDGSADRSSRICDDFASKDDRVRVIHKENAGVSAARNDGITAAIGEYITFIDADDWIEVDFIETLMSYKDYPLVVTGYQEFGVRNRLRGPLVTMKISNCKDIREIWKDKDSTYWWFVWGKLFRRSNIVRNGLHFKEGVRYLEDFCFVLEYLCCIENLYMDPSKKMHHLIEAEKYAKYRMDYSEFHRHMEVLDNCLKELEQKSLCEFVEMRERISFRLFYNFTQYLAYSSQPLKHKLYNVDHYQKAKDDSLFRHIYIEKYGLKIRTLWAVMTCLRAISVKHSQTAPIP